MSLTLPCSGLDFEVKSLSRNQLHELDKKQAEFLALCKKAEEGDDAASAGVRELGFRFWKEDLILELYPEIKEKVEENAHDVAYLCGVVENYSRGMNENAIKNLLTSGSGTTVRTKKKK
ncbi:hypothetical protein [Maridesulfovibrio sp.]|uniref:hypothetical protein n=1 Tax=Maridesulfovibrio sp. TaxID=2795000 RepID=UPI0029C9C91D|nr:hypothetical protein [Maridesulfovibrio sp.]